MMQRILDLVEQVGNKVPHPVIILLTLIAVVVVLSHILALLGTSFTTEVIVPTAVTPAAYDGAAYDTGTSVTYQTMDEKQYKIEQRTIVARNLLTVDGIRFVYSSLIPSFMGFTAVGPMIVALVGAGVAEESGLVKTLIRKLVVISPGWAMTYILAFVGILSSIAADAGYLVLIPLAGTAFISLGRRRQCVHREHAHQAARRRAGGVYERRHSSGGPDQVDRPGVQPVVLNRLGGVSDHAMSTAIPLDVQAAEDHLMRFLAVEGVTGEEKAIAEAVVDELKKVGVPASAIRYDSVHQRIQLPTQTGNLLVELPGTRPGPRLLFSTHLDTVPLCAGAKPKREGDRIVSDGTTALGGDNRTGCAVLVSLVETLLKHQLPHPPITLLFTVREESGLHGARELDPKDLGGAAMCFNVDGKLAAEPITGAVGQENWDVEIKGKAAHAGVAPDKGTSAMLVAAIALTEAHRGG